jgi:hypothetical protein
MWDEVVTIWLPHGIGRGWGSGWVWRSCGGRCGDYVEVDVEVDVELDVVVRWMCNVEVVGEDEGVQCTVLEDTVEVGVVRRAVG